MNKLLYHKAKNIIEKDYQNLCHPSEPQKCDKYLKMTLHKDILPKNSIFKQCKSSPQADKFTNNSSVSLPILATKYSLIQDKKRKKP